MYARIRTGRAEQNLPNTLQELIETRLATLERKDNDILEVRFKPGMKLDMAGLEEIITERQRICPAGRVRVLTVFPPETDFDMAIMTLDHYKNTGLDTCTEAVAMAASSDMNERMANIYFAYYPQRFPTRVFLEEADARKWLADGVFDRSMN